MPGDTNDEEDDFVHDRRTGAITRVNVSTTGEQAVFGGAGFRDPQISASANAVVFTSAATDLVPEGGTPGRTHVYVRDIRAGTTQRVSVAVSGGEPNNNSGGVGPITADGRFVYFNSLASDLVAGDDNGLADSFVFDRRTGRTTLVSLAADGAQGNRPVDNLGGDITPGGGTVAWVSAADNLIPGDVPGSIDVFARGIGRGHNEEGEDDD